MSALGQYVHFSWAGYEAGGTYRNEAGWDKTRLKASRAAASNYGGAGVFNLFSDNIANRAKQIKKVNIQQLEEDYNTLRKNKFTQFQKLASTRPEDFLSLMTLVVENANLGSAIKPEVLAEYLVLDEKNKNISLKSTQALTESVEVKKLRQLAAGNENSYSYLDTLRRAAKTAELIINNSPDKETLLPKLNFYFKWMEDLENRIVKQEQRLPGYSQIQKSTAKAGNQKIYKTTLPRKAARAILSRIITLAEAADLSINLAKLQASFTEVMGASISGKGEDVAVQAIKEYLTGLIKTKPGTTATPGVDIYLDEVIMKNEYDKMKKNNMVLIKTPSGEVTFKTDYETQDKADFILEWGGRDLGISAKAYNLDVKEIYDPIQKKNIPNYISLQKGTSLLIFLLNLEQNGFSPIGTHFLNVFAQHGNIETRTITTPGGDYTSVRKAAEDALLIGLLYNALSGELSLKEKNYADLLMIENKSQQVAPGVHRVHFYNISTIVERVLNNIDKMKSSLYISPDLNMPPLHNEWANSPKERITKLLLVARQIKFNIGINIASLDLFRE